MTCQLLFGDCRERLLGLETNSIGFICTDPPYERRILGAAWDGTGVAFDKAVWSECLRVLKPGGYLAAFGSWTYHRLACAIEDAGFVLRDELVWLKGGANMPKGGRLGPAIDKRLGAKRPVVGSRTLSGTAALSCTERGGTHSVGVDSRGRKKSVAITAPGSPEAERWENYGYNLKRVQELICLAQKPPEGSAAANLLKWGVGALNVDMAGAPGNGRSVQQWPANVIVTHHPDCTPLLGCHQNCPSHIIGEQSGPCRSAGNKRPTTGAGAIHGSTGRRDWSVEEVSKGDNGTAARYYPTWYYSVKTAKRHKTMDGAVDCPVQSVKPAPVIRWLAQLIGPPGETGLDMFGGSGTFGVVCTALGYPCVVIEAKEEHYECAEKRIKIAQEWHRTGKLLPFLSL